MTLRTAWLVALVGCGPGSDPVQPAPEPPPPAPKAAPAPVVEVVYVMASRLRMRPQPSSETATFTRLPINTKLRKLATDGDWLRVTTPDGGEGYVHGDYVASEPLMLDELPAKIAAAADDAERLSWAQRGAALAPRDARALEQLAGAYEAVGDAKMAAKVRRVVTELSQGFDGWFPELHGEFDQITEALPRAASASELIALYERALAVTEGVSEPLNTVFLYGDPTVDGAADVLEKRVPWGYLTFYAEGTHAALELDNDQWLAAAKRTPEALDDDFLALQVLAYGQVSGRGWASWQQREWDYGGCSPFGNGQDLHLRVLLAADPLRAEASVADRVDAIRADALHDIAKPNGPGEFPYCMTMGEPTPSDGLQAEADKLLAQVKLTEAEAAMVRARKKAGFAEP